MEWFRQNWFFILFFVIFIGMHLFGGGCMGGHGGHRGHGEGEEHKEHEGKDSSEKKKGGHGCC
jgi:hypothetical protein